MSLLSAKMRFAVKFVAIGCFQTTRFCLFSGIVGSRVWHDDQFYNYMYDSPWLLRNSSVVSQSRGFRVCQRHVGGSESHGLLG